VVVGYLLLPVLAVLAAAVLLIALMLLEVRRLSAAGPLRTTAPLGTASNAIHTFEIAICDLRFLVSASKNRDRPGAWSDLADRRLTAIARDSSSRVSSNTSRRFRSSSVSPTSTSSDP
jgi:hypothetical protein